MQHSAATGVRCTALSQQGTHRSHAATLNGAARSHQPAQGRRPGALSGRDGTQSCVARAAAPQGEGEKGPEPSFLESLSAAPGQIVGAVKEFPRNVTEVVQGAGATGAALLVSSTPGVPEYVRRQHSEAASARSEEVFARVFAGGDKLKWRRDVSFYIDGFARLARDFSRDRDLLLADPASLDARLQRRRDAALADLRALVPFLLLVMNTFPLTPLFVGPMIDRMPQWRSLWLPSQARRSAAPEGGRIPLLCALR